MCTEMAVCPVCRAELSRAATRVYPSKENEFDWSLSSGRDIQSLGRDRAPCVCACLRRLNDGLRIQYQWLVNRVQADV